MSFARIEPFIVAHAKLLPSNSQVIDGRRLFRTSVWLRCYQFVPSLQSTDDGGPDEHSSKTCYIFNGGASLPPVSLYLSLLSFTFNGRCKLLKLSERPSNSSSFFSIPDFIYCRSYEMLLANEMPAGVLLIGLSRLYADSKRFQLSVTSPTDSSFEILNQRLQQWRLLVFARQISRIGGLTTNTQSTFYE